MAVLLVAAIGAGTAYALRGGKIPLREASPVHSSPVFAPYVDVTLTPPYAFQDKTASPARALILGFVVASPGKPCAPSWGGYYTPDQAADALDLDRRIAQAEGQDTAVIGSFGGQANRELALACKDPKTLADAYKSVVDRYRFSEVDFDIEGTAVADAASVKRRALAVRRLQDEKRSLPVWLTLPLAPHGIDAATAGVVRQMLAAHVRLAGINLMAMDYGPPVKDMFATSRAALRAAHSQLSAVYLSSGIRLSSTRMWSHMGATVMIGQNDSPGEQFTAAGARSLAAFADASHLGRLSIWSLNRDRQCGVTFPLVGTHSNLCSGVRQAQLEFTNILRRRATRTAPVTPAAEPSPSVAATPGPDDPARSPYPIWQPAFMYQARYKVVWHRAVYQARYFSQGQPPDQPAAGGAPSPWQLLGPVLPTDRAPKLPRLKTGTYPSWDPRRAYRSGDRVLVDRLPYAAKWYTEGTPPNSQSIDPSASPWKPLYKIPGEPSS